MTSFRLTTLKKESKTQTPQRFSLSEDLKYMLVCSPTSYELYNLISRTQALKFEVPKNGSVTYAKLENGILIAQWQAGSMQRVVVRDIGKNGIVSYETDSFKGEILNHAVITGTPNIEIIANVKGGKFKRILVGDDITVSDVNIKSSGKPRKMFWVETEERLVIWEEKKNIVVYERISEEGFSSREILGTNYKMDDVFEFHRGEEPGLMLISTADVNNPRAEFRSLRANIQPNDDRPITWNLGYQHTSSHHIVSLRDLYKGKSFLPRALAIIEDVYFNWNILYIDEQGNVRTNKYEYPTNKLLDFLQNTTVTTCGIYLVPHYVEKQDKKFTLCVIGENGNSVLLDKGPFKNKETLTKVMEELNREELSLEKLDEQNFEDELHGTQEIRFAKQKKTDDFLDLYKYNLFTGDFELSVGGLEFMEICVPSLITDEMNINKANLLKFLLETKREQYLIDIIMEKRNETESNDYRLLELEKLEKSVFECFTDIKDQYDRGLLPQDNYESDLKSILRLFSAIIDRKEDEARENERLLGQIGPNEEEILISYKKDEAFVIREDTYIQICKFSEGMRLADIYNDHYPEIKNKWNQNRNYFKTEGAQFDKRLRTSHDFFIDLFLDNSPDLFPFKDFSQVLNYIRENRIQVKDMKFLIFYIIAKELDQSKHQTEEIKVQFNKHFELTDQELVFLNGLTRLDIIIELYIQTKAPYKDEFLKLAKEACLCLCSYKLPDKRWKDFVLTTFYRYECYEELTIFIRAGDINWSEGSFAQKLIIILIQEYKILQAYDFVSGLLQLEENPVDNKFTQYFEFFLETLINSGNQERKRDDFNIQSSSKKVGFDAFLDISLYSHEKVITERFFTENVNYSKYFILYLVRAGRIIDAVEFAIKNVFHIKNDLQSVDIIQNLVNLVDKLPEPMELAIKSNTDFVKLKNIGDRIAEEAVENPDQELTNARTTLYRTNTLRSLPDVSQDSSHEEIKASPEERVGLNFRKPDGDLEESKDESKIMEQRSRLEDQSGMAIENSRLDQSEGILRIQKAPESPSEEPVEGIKPRATKRKLLNYF